MKMLHRFFVNRQCFHDSKVVITDQQAHQILRVLRLRAGDRVIVLDNEGWEYEVVLVAINKSQLTFELIDKRRAKGEPQTRIILYQSMLAREKFEWLLQKCTEVGVCRFTPVITQRSLVRKSDTVGPAKLERWQRIITEAAEQSHRGLIPEIDRPIGFTECLSRLSEFDLVLIASLDEDSKPLGKCLEECGKPKNIALLIGPEGGFTDDEIRLAYENGAAAINLGPRVLRTETAAMVASALVLYELGQMEK
jgi:16S rRNA (uracil1498-N3)-methyltransferase